VKGVKVIPTVKAPETRQGAARQFGRRLTDVEVLEGLPSVEELHDELLGYTDVILGRADPPLEINGFYLDLMEVAAAYYARAKEIDMLIHWEEQNRRVIRGSVYYKFRTGSLRSFIEMAKMMADLGSRRLSQERLLSEQRYDAGNGD
jgi:hypothetical protein